MSTNSFHFPNYIRKNINLHSYPIHVRVTILIIRMHIHVAHLLHFFILLTSICLTLSLIILFFILHLYLHLIHILTFSTSKNCRCT